jgi:nitrilase
MTGIFGRSACGPIYNKDGLISVVEIDLNDIVKARYDMDPMGHYSRPDVFKLTVNEQERPPIFKIGTDTIKEF